MPPHVPQRDRWLRLATGKTVLGGLLGGYFGAELAKRSSGYKLPTGDIFAAMVPLALIAGRIGCLQSGCCLGRICPQTAWWTLADPTGAPRWPAVPLEIAFNLATLPILAALRKNNALPGQHFHLYLIAYGLFRLAHEFQRDTPPILAEASGYAILALAVATAGAWGFHHRARARKNMAET
jgi:phosphatidylglycerol---prolipoprotein diacylglyceryl transferase